MTIYTKLDPVISIPNNKENKEFSSYLVAFTGKIPQMSRKTVSTMFYSAELENEFRYGKLLSGIQCRFRKNDDVEKYIEEAVMKMSCINYDHNPSSGCADRG